MKVRLADICEIAAGGTPSRNCVEYWRDGNIPWVKIGDFNGKYLTETEEKITDLGLSNSSAKLFPRGTILYTIFATLGEVCILNIDASTNQAICGLKIKADNIDINYLYYFLCSIKETVIKIGRGVAQNNINLSILKNFEIEICNLEKQKKISSILDKLSALLEKRKQQLGKLDLIVKSKFIEMFGDCLNGTRGWIKCELNTICDVRDGTHDSPKYHNDGVPLITSKNITGGYLDFTTVNFISKEDAAQINKRSKVDKGDILLPMIGTVGGAVIVDVEPYFCIKNVALIKFTKSNISNVFIREYLNSVPVKALFDSIKSGGTQKFVGLGTIRKLTVSVPPLELQNNFEEFIDKINRLKNKIKQSLEKLETLKKALMQKYFG